MSDNAFDCITNTIGEPFYFDIQDQQIERRDEIERKISWLQTCIHCGGTEQTVSELHFERGMSVEEIVILTKLPLSVIKEELDNAIESIKYFKEFWKAMFRSAVKTFPASFDKKLSTGILYRNKAKKIRHF